MGEKNNHTQKLALDIFQSLNRTITPSEAIYQILDKFKKHIGVSAAAIRLKENGDYPYFYYDGFKDIHIEMESSLCSFDEMGQTLTNNLGVPLLACMCGRVLEGKYDLNLVTTGFYAMLPLLAGAVGNWVSGYTVDAIYKKGNWKLSRQVPAIIGFGLVVIGILSSLYMETALGAVLCLSIAIFGADMTLSPSWSFCMDIGKEHSGKVSGMMNMAGNLGAFSTALAFPYLLAWTGSNEPFFYVAAFLGVVAIFCWLFMDSSKAIRHEK